MANIIPTDQKFHTLAGFVNTTERGSGHVNDRSAVYTMQDIIDTVSGEVSGALASDINITNYDAAFTHIGGVIPADTTLETAIRLILEKYNATSITLTSLSVYLENVGGGYPVSPTTISANTTIEAGRNFKINSFNFSIGNTAVTADTSVSLIVGQTIIEDGISDSVTAYTLTSPYEITNPAAGPTGSTYSFKAKADDTGGSGTIPIQSISKTINVYSRVRVGGDVTAVLNNSSQALAMFGALNTHNSLSKRLSNANASISFAGDLDTNNANKYTWIAYPASWGDIAIIKLDGANSILSDFEAPVDYAFTNDFGVTITHRFYRTTSKGAISSAMNITVFF